ncbi:MAG: glycosyltransferase family 4 protein [Candidatus Omnitrophica bacterium]|nr:glycosyltransferase family 4 protein [Candidatus Omnitrophota bacterium]
MRVLVLTSEWPDEQYLHSGIFVYRQVKCLRDVGIEVEVLNFRGRGNLVEYLKAFLKLKETMKAKQYDLIHAHFGQAAFLAVWQQEAPVVATFHGSDLCGLSDKIFMNKFKGLILKTCSYIVGKRADSVIVVSEKLLKHIKRSADVVSMGVDLTLFVPGSFEDSRKLLGWQNDKKIVLFVGNPSNPIKRYFLAQEAILLLKEENPLVELKTCYNESREKMPHYMSAADVLVVTSVHEGASMTVVEALACNLPVVSVDVGHVRKYIGSLDGCVLCEDDTPQVVTAALKEIINNRSRIQGRDRVKELDERVVIRKVVDVYEKTIKQFKMNKSARGGHDAVGNTPKLERTGLGCFGKTH